MNIKNTLYSMYSNKYAYILVLIAYALLIFCIGRNTNYFFLVFLASISILGIYMIPMQWLRCLIFIAFAFLATAGYTVPPFTKSFIERWHPVSGDAVKKYHFKIADIKSTEMRYGKIPLFLFIEGKNLDNMDYTLKGAVVAGAAARELYIAPDDYLVKIPVSASYDADIELILRAKPGTSFELFRGPEVHNRDLYFDTVYLTQESDKIKAIYYPKLEKEAPPFPKQELYPH